MARPTNFSVTIPYGTLDTERGAYLPLTSPIGDRLEGKPILALTNNDGEEERRNCGMVMGMFGMGGIRDIENVCSPGSIGNPSTPEFYI